MSDRIVGWLVQDRMYASDKAYFENWSEAANFADGGENARSDFIGGFAPVGLVLASDLTAAEARIAELDKLIVQCTDAVFATTAAKQMAEAVADRRLGLLKYHLRFMTAGSDTDDLWFHDSDGVRKSLKALTTAEVLRGNELTQATELTGTPVADGGDNVCSDPRGHAYRIPDAGKESVCMFCQAVNKDWPAK